MEIDKIKSIKETVPSFAITQGRFGQFFIILTLVLLLIFLYFLGYKIIAPALSILSIFLDSFRCNFEAISTIPCPGCGGTRSFVALCEGQIIKSFNLNSMVLFFAVGFTFLILGKLFKWPLTRNPLQIFFVALFLFSCTWVLKFF